MVKLLAVILTLGLFLQNADSSLFDFIVFTQMWPQSACIDAINEHHKCALNKNITTWTVHGLWPNKNGVDPPGPNFCNDSSKFDPSAIEPILGQMKMYWPNTYLDTPLYNFWTHEWEKHGTCAASDPLLNSQYKYFSAGLKLNRAIDILSVLTDGGITPSETITYKEADIVNVLTKALKHHVLIRCIYDKKSSRHYLDEVEVCVSPTLRVVDCPQPRSLGQAELCPDNRQIYYTPLQYDYTPLQYD